MAAALLIPPPPAEALPLSYDGDLIVDFRNRDPNNANNFIDYPAGVTGVFSIYTDLKDKTAERITVSVTPSSSHCEVKIDAQQLNTIKAGTRWSFRLKFPDTDLMDGYDKVVANGEVVRYDGALS